MMMRKFILIPGLLFITVAFSQNQEELYEKSLITINDMLVNPKTFNFKKGVYSIENAYLNGRLDSTFFNNEIKKLKSVCQLLIDEKSLKYDGMDKEDVTKWASVYRVMCDTIPITFKGNSYNYIPFAYNFEDVFGTLNYENVFVSKLLFTRKGTCRSLPYLYKILCEELGTTASLALAPNHIYIKHYSTVNGWYNTELTSGIFPNDAWLMASGYIHLDAIKNKVYMKALDNTESLALLFIDLATAYQKSFPDHDDSFISICAELAIKAYPNLVSALILKAEINKKLLSSKKNVAFEDEKSIDDQYRLVHELGYRNMPIEMYLDWLLSLKKEKGKFENNNFKKLDKKK